MRKSTGNKRASRLLKAGAFMLFVAGAARFCLPEAAPLEFGGFGKIGTGYASNILRQPEAMDTGNGVYNPVHGESEINGEGLFRISSGNRFKMLLRGGTDVYPGHIAANEYWGDARMEFRFQASPAWKFKLSGSNGYYRRLGIDESGDGAPNLWQYWELGLGLKTEYQPSKRLNLNAEYDFAYEDHHERPPEESLDNRRHEFSLSALPRFGAKGRHRIILKTTTAFKTYYQLLSYDSSGRQTAGYPSRQYQYFSIETGYQREFADGLWELLYRPRFRLDPFEDYYSFYENGFLGKAIFNFPHSIRLGLEGSWKNRSYSVHEAYRPGPNPKLVMSYLDWGILCSKKIGKPLLVEAEWTFSRRETNTGYLYLHGYRNYACHDVRTAFRWNFQD